MRLSALVAAAILGACGFLPPTPPDWVTNRLPLDSCGTETPEGLNAEARACLLRAFEEGRGAELISTEPSIEGDLITRYIRVHEDGVVEIFVDATRDRFGSGEWERIGCAQLVAVEEVNDAPDLFFPADYVFVEQRCQQLPVP